MFILIERTLNALFIFIKKITSPSARFRDIRISKKSPKIAIPKIYRGRQIRGRNVRVVSYLINADKRIRHFYQHLDRLFHFRCCFLD